MWRWCQSFHPRRLGETVWRMGVTESFDGPFLLWIKIWSVEKQLDKCRKYCSKNISKLWKTSVVRVVQNRMAEWRQLGLIDAAVFCMRAKRSIGAIWNCISLQEVAAKAAASIPKYLNLFKNFRFTFWSFFCSRFYNKAFCYVFRWLTIILNIAFWEWNVLLIFNPIPTLTVLLPEST